jgi:hypothetical protein
VIPAAFIGWPPFLIIVALALGAVAIFRSATNHRR